LALVSYKPITPLYFIIQGNYATHLQYFTGFEVRCRSLINMYYTVARQIPYGRCTEPHTESRTDGCTGIPASVPIAIRKMTCDDTPIYRELFPPRSSAENLQFLQINSGEVAEIRIGFQAGGQYFRTGFRHGISNLVSGNFGAD